MVRNDSDGIPLWYFFKNNVAALASIITPILESDTSLG